MTTWSIALDDALVTHDSPMSSLRAGETLTEKQLTAFANLPDEQKRAIVADWTIVDLERHCLVSKLFRERFCRSTHVVWATWLERDFGLAPEADRCTNASPWARRLIAESMRRHAFDADSDTPGARKRGTARLHERLYRLLLRVPADGYGVLKSKTHTDRSYLIDRLSVCDNFLFVLAKHARHRPLFGYGSLVTLLMTRQLEEQDLARYVGAVHIARSRNQLVHSISIALNAPNWIVGEHGIVTANGRFVWLRERLLSVDDDRDEIFERFPGVPEQTRQSLEQVLHADDETLVCTSQRGELFRFVRGRPFTGPVAVFESLLALSGGHVLLFGAKVEDDDDSASDSKQNAYLFELATGRLVLDQWGLRAILLVDTTRQIAAKRRAFFIRVQGMTLAVEIARVGEAPVVRMGRRLRSMGALYGADHLEILESGAASRKINNEKAL